MPATSFNMQHSQSMNRSHHSYSHSHHMRAGSRSFSHGMAEGAQSSSFVVGSQLVPQGSGHAAPITSIGGNSLYQRRPSKEVGVNMRTRSSMVPRHACSSFVSKNYEVVRQLGKGSFSQVKLLRDKRTGGERVLKVTEGGMGTKECQMLKNEIQVLSALDHPNIVKIYAYSEDMQRGQLLLVLEYFGGGDCQQLMRKDKRPQAETFVAKLISQLLLALSYCHTRGIVHCDVKPENMMLTVPRHPYDTPDCKVIDFGLTHRIDEPTRDFVGTPSYMAPEIVKGTIHYTLKADLWSVGVTACELLSQKAPFGRPCEYKGKIDPVLEKIKKCTAFADVEGRIRTPAWKSRSSLAQAFVAHLLHVDHATRPTANKALKHPWMVDNKDAARQLGPDMLKSMVRFMGSTALIRRCMLIVASRMSSLNRERIGAVFVGLDTNNDGKLTREELAGAIAPSLIGCWEPEIDIDDYFDAADQDSKGEINYTHFMATCLIDAKSTPDVIAQRAFDALDDNHDGLVRMDEVRHLFREQDLLKMKSLPTNRPFNLNEWRALVLADCGAHGQKSRPERPETGLLGKIMKALQCKNANHDDEEDYEEVWN